MFSIPQNIQDVNLLNFFNKLIFVHRFWVGPKFPAWSSFLSTAKQAYKIQNGDIITLVLKRHLKNSTTS